jgi:hypothetical protein
MGDLTLSGVTGDIGCTHLGLSLMAKSRKLPANMKRVVQPPSPPTTEDSPATEWRALRHRLSMFGVFLASVIIDLAFVALWVLIHRLVGIGLERLGELEGFDRLVLAVIRVIFDVSTLSVIGAYTIWDLFQSVRRIWAMKS